jgi:hypothetical protein
VQPERQRPANLWEVPGIDAIMQAVRNVDKGLPTRIKGRMWNQQWAGNPCPADAIWPGNDHGVNREYMCEFIDGFVAVLNGVKDRVTLTPTRPTRLEFFDPIAGKIVVNAQGTTSVPAGPGGYIVRGYYL